MISAETFSSGGINLLLEWDCRGNFNSVQSTVSLDICPRERYKRLWEYSYSYQAGRLQGMHSGYWGALRSNWRPQSRGLKGAALTGTCSCPEKERVGDLEGPTHHSWVDTENPVGASLLSGSPPSSALWLFNPLPFTSKAPSLTVYPYSTALCKCLISPP